MKKTIFAAVAAAAVSAIAGEGARFVMDRSAMSPAYWKIWNDAAQKKIDEGIEKNRKADASAEIPAPDGTEVEIEQVSHAFFFGAHIFNFNQLGSKEKNDRYKELFGTLFNTATVPFYWRTLEPRPGEIRFDGGREDTEEFWNACKNPSAQPHWRRPAPGPVIDFLKKKGVRVHGHPLAWGNNEWMTPNWLWDDLCPESEKRALEKAAGVKFPRWNPKLPAGVKNPSAKAWENAWKKTFAKLSDDEIARLVPTFLKKQKELYEKRIAAIARRFGDRVDSWDVVNESATDFGRFGGKSVRNRKFDRSWYGPMPADYAANAFKTAAKNLLGNAWLVLNDYNMGDVFWKQALDLAANGAKIDAIGSQMHIFNGADMPRIAAGKGPAHLRPENIAARFRSLSRAGRPVILSETTIPAPDNSPKGQMIQAIAMRNLYRAWFAQKEIAGITCWSVTDAGSSPGEQSSCTGLFTADMQPKTAYWMLDDLINREWKTKTKATVRGGKIAFRGFRGGYRLKWKDPAGKPAFRDFVLK